MPLSTSAHALLALSPLDGRYAAKTAGLRDCFSEFALIRARVQVECEWLIALSAAGLPGFKPLGEASERWLRQQGADFTPAQAARVKALERETNHDVKAVEYWLRERLSRRADLKRALPFVHFACTSEDINNIAYALLLQRAARKTLLPRLSAIQARLGELAERWAGEAMLARTHGQAATPTTMGKEMANIEWRLASACAALAACTPAAKINGATGNYNAHCVASPEIDWERFAKGFIESLGLQFLSHTTQIEPHDGLAAWCDALARANTILLDCSRDIWGYISLGYFRLRTKAGEVGSSTMPHKVNPIDFENAEGNLGLANALLHHFSAKLPVSRWQRDLSDSTVLRNLGVALGYALLAQDSLLKGLEKIDLDKARLRADLDANWEVLAEPVQTLLRRYGVKDAYEQLKALTRGRSLNRAALHRFIRTLKLPPEAKARLLELTPQNYLGLAKVLASRRAAATQR